MRSSYRRNPATFRLWLTAKVSAGSTGRARVRSVASLHRRSAASGRHQKWPAPQHAGIWPFRHFRLKLLSVALALLLWMVISGEETVERGLRVPLELVQFPAGLELVGEVPTIADVRVRGASGTLSRLSPGDIVAVLDLRGARPGGRLFHLTPEQVRAPFDVEVVHVTPATVAVLFEASASRMFPIGRPLKESRRPAYGRQVTVTPPNVNRGQRHWACC